MSLDHKTREQRIREAGGRQTYVLELLEDIAEGLAKLTASEEASAAAGEPKTATPESGEVETASTYKPLPEEKCRQVELTNPNEDVIRWRLVEEGGRGNEVAPGDSAQIKVEDASEIEVRGAETGMAVEWAAVR